MKDGGKYYSIFYCFTMVSGITKKVSIPTATICSRQTSNMELYDSEESCSSESYSSSVYSASIDSQESSVDSYPRLPSKTVLNKKKNRKRIPHILDKLYYREVRYITGVEYKFLCLVLLVTMNYNCFGSADQG
jgi:hypothetical protein